MEYCPQENFQQLADAISRIETYLGLRNSIDFNTISGKLKDITSYIAGENVEKYNVVKMNDDGKVVKASYLDLVDKERIVGIILDSGNMNDIINIQSFGRLSNDLWNWDTTKPIFLGDNGQITQDVPSSGFLLRLGNVISSDEILINISIPIIL